MNERGRVSGLAVALCMAASLQGAVAWGQGVQVALLPVLSIVPQGGEFTLELSVPQAGSGFNAYDGVIRWDPAVLTLLPGTRAETEGSLMTGACATTFYRVTASTESLAVNTHSLLCGGVTLTGPGTLLRLRFAATGPPGETAVTLDRMRFYDAGLRVTPVETQQGLVRIGNPLGAEAPPGGALRLTAAPNPFHGRIALRLELGGGGPAELAVVDLSGRVVRHLETVPATSGSWTVSWDGRDDGGRAVAPGIYLARLRGPGGQVTARLARLE